MSNVNVNVDVGETDDGNPSPSIFRRIWYARNMNNGNTNCCIHWATTPSPLSNIAIIHCTRKERMGNLKCVLWI